MSPIVYSNYNTTLKGMQTCINVLVQIYTPAYFDMGLFSKALEITWAKPMNMKYIFLCKGGMHLLITGFASNGYLNGKGRLGELSLSPRFFKKAMGILQSPPSVRMSVHPSVRPSVRPSRYLLLNHWTKSNQIWCVGCSHEWGVQRHIFFWPRPLGPWGGAKRSNIIKYH